MKPKRQLLFSIIFIFCCFSIFSQQYKISEVTYSLEKTKEFALRNKVLVDTNRVFQDVEELESYKNSLMQKLYNLRAFENIEINFSELPALEENSELDPPVTNLSCSISATDSKSILVVPYPVYDSNSGLQFKFKARNTNFLGTLEPLIFEIAFGKDYSELSEEKDYFFSAALEFYYQIECAPIVAKWNNLYTFNYNFNDTRAQFLTSTGVDIEYPFNRFSLAIKVDYKLARDFEYTEYDDEFYYNCYKKISIPIKLVKSEEKGDLILEPFGEYTENYDVSSEYLKEFASTYFIPFVGKSHIDDNNDDLSSPTAAIGTELHIKSVNWYGNLRKGYAFKAGYKQAYNFQISRFEPYVYSNSELFWTKKIFGIASRIDFFYSRMYRSKIGEKLRGIADKQKYVESNKKALKTPSAITLNLDFPISVVETDWTGWIDNIFGEESWFGTHFQWMKTFNFELQISPFLDAALTKNEATDRLFDYRDGWYSGGVEILVYPSKWKSVVVRASAGFDLGRKLIEKKFPHKLDYSWRENVSAREIYAGIGLLY